MEVISRADAKAAGLKRYYTGKPCPHGHIAERLVCNWHCVVCDYARRDKWNADNAERCSKNYRAWYEANKERRKETDRVWRARNYDRALQTDRAWRARNKDLLSKRNREWQINNRDRVNSKEHKRRAKTSGGMPSAEFAAWVERQHKRCYWCGKGCANDFEVDHYVPLARGGEHVASNLVISCAPCNRRKYATDPYVFAQRVGRLF